MLRKGFRRRLQEGEWENTAGAFYGLGTAAVLDLVQAAFWPLQAQTVNRFAKPQKAVCREGRRAVLYLPAGGKALPAGGLPRLSRFPKAQVFIYWNLLEGA